jgi:D-glycerate 3-kinase
MFPANLHNCPPTQLQQTADRVSEVFLQAGTTMGLDCNLEQVLKDTYLPLAAILSQQQDATRTLLVGVNGAQGAGKSTLCDLLTIVLEQGFGKQTISLSIDDLYLTRDERQQLAQTVHPLFVTRGVPGTHDVELGLQLFTDLKSLAAEHTLKIPRFDKAVDDRLPPKQWPTVSGPVDIILFEGWCVGARPQPHTALRTPINTLEQLEDADEIWRRAVNLKLERQYTQLFNELDLLLMLQVPGMGNVLEWRSLQERKLAAASTGKTDHQIMDRAALQRFIMHYERLTCWMLEEMPHRADLVMKLNADHQIAAVHTNGTNLTEST